MEHNNRITTSPVNTGNESDFKSAAAFSEITNVLKKDGPSIVKKIKGTYSFKVKNSSGKQGVWFVDVKSGNGTVTFGDSKKADCTITMSDDDLLGMMTGTLNAQKAFMTGKLKIAGNMGLAMKLKELRPSTPKAKL